MKKTIIKNASLVNEGVIKSADILIEGSYISRIDRDISSPDAIVLEASDSHVFPGVIDDQVHFRQPGFTHKGDISTGSKAALAGGITTFIEQPNTNPQTTSIERLEEKMSIAKRDSYINYSFMLGGTNDNIEQIKSLDKKAAAGIKLFLGSSTGNMLVDDQQALEQIFKSTGLVISAHCEDENTIRENLFKYKSIYGDDIPMECHYKIRSEQACYISSRNAINLAKQTNARLHVFHLSTAKEVDLFDNKLPLKDKKITSEVCIHHLWFSESDYAKRGSLIKWNPAIKTSFDRQALLQALLDDKIDVVATDHAPHTLEEKQQVYTKAPSGGPMVQHALVAMLELAHKGLISLPKIVEKMCHNPAILFDIEKRGFIREGYYADLTLIDLETSWRVHKDNILYKCGWSPFEGLSFQSKIMQTFVNGHLAYNKGLISDELKSMRLSFQR